VPDVVHTWQDAVDGCLTQLESQAQAREISKASVQRYETSLVQITLALGWDPDGATASVPLHQITKATLSDFVEARREEGRSTSTILNDLTAWSHVMGYASQKDWIQENPIWPLDRRKLVGSRRTRITPPTDPEVASLITEVSAWSQDVARLMRWLRETGMRLGEVLNLRAGDIHPGGTKATLRLGVKRNRGADGGPMTRSIDLGRAAPLLAELPGQGRLFAALPADSAVVSTRYGQWRRQKQAREDRAAAKASRASNSFKVYRLHDLRHAFAVASLVDDPDCIYRLSEHLGHTLVSTTEIYTGHLRRDGAMWRYSRDRSLYGSLATPAAAAPTRTEERASPG
jgi:integrase/recombinase XerD